MPFSKNRTQLNLEYRVLRCKVGATSVGLGLIGTVSFGGRPQLVFSATREVPPDVPGLDDVGRALLAAVPESIHNDLLEIARGVTLDPMGHFAKRYRGTVFADVSKDCRLRAKPDQLEVLKAVTSLFGTEVLEQPSPAKRHTARAAKRTHITTKVGSSQFSMFPDLETRSVLQSACSA
jgi:hypothetical protein